MSIYVKTFLNSNKIQWNIKGLKKWDSAIWKKLKMTLNKISGNPSIVFEKDFIIINFDTTILFWLENMATIHTYNEPFVLYSF